MLSVFSKNTQHYKETQVTGCPPSVPYFFQVRRCQDRIRNFLLSFKGQLLRVFLTNRFWAAVPKECQVMHKNESSYKLSALDSSLYLFYLKCQNVLDKKLWRTDVAWTLDFVSYRQLCYKILSQNVSKCIWKERAYLTKMVAVFPPFQ